MRQLISAGLVRLWRSKALWLSCAVAAAYEIFSLLSRLSKDGDGWRVVYGLDGCFFLFAGLVGFLSALICAFIVGPEHSDGTMRSKIVAGHSRRDVYLAYLTLSALASLITCLAAILPGLALGLPLLGGFEMSAARVCVMILGICALSVTYAGIFTAVTMLISGWAVSLTAVVVLALVLLVAGSYLSGLLSAPPTIVDVGIPADGQSAVHPNPAYIPEGPLRSALLFLYDLLPGGQTGQYITNKVARPERLIALDAVIFASVTLAGLALFRRKDLK